ncbi:uncharacterized protein DUF3152 [Asanoa ferruginea]|uniref:Uncharacterized protein DUF3152 n=1 Tax=Asanoa ferruginea TaxID=53367 RepID=A0A3D9ZDV2_9ACTN|nr:DUF3152 domain-containing protein [Asanoa ferruginea]REF95445.1 uncharacterized protein DUF3152 [Asanoa ferruginea]GIF46714.1 lipoprotein [Asanoa ferruginea]
MSLLVGIGLLVFGLRPGDARQPRNEVAAASATPDATETAPPTVAATKPPKPVYRLAGTPPERGDNTFKYGKTTGKIAGTGGPLRRYRIAVENGSGEDIEKFGDQVDAALSDPRSWIASGDLRLQRVAEGESYSFTVYLATMRTSHDMCARGGTNTNNNGEPYTSCRTPGKVIINLDRWDMSVPHFISAKIPLSVYRTYVANHETGHELGHSHVRCPGAGKPAPVMMQQTLFLNGCKPNPYPYVNGKLNTGPPL